MRVHRVTRTCSSSLIQKGPRMGQTWPIPEAHGHGALVTAERCFGIDMKVFPRPKCSSQSPDHCMHEAASCLLNGIIGAKNMLKGQ